MISEILISYAKICNNIFQFIIGDLKCFPIDILQRYKDDWILIHVFLAEIRMLHDVKIFEQFISMMYGVRAGFVLIRRYINHYHRDTVPQVISAWAPSSENDTTKYIDRVCQLSEIGPVEKLVYTNMEQMLRLVDAMIVVECGQHISEQAIRDGYLHA